jgi:hypothetical protein
MPNNIVVHGSKDPSPAIAPAAIDVLPEDIEMLLKQGIPLEVLRNVGVYDIDCAGGCG